MCLFHSQGPELGHVVEAGHWDAADVVVVQCSAKHCNVKLGECIK